jgi:hypothetical protein
MSRYVPPALRRRGDAANGSAPAETARGDQDIDDDFVSTEEIRNHFWPNTNEESGASSSDPSSSRTLHDSAAKSGELAYVFLCKSAAFRCSPVRLRGVELAFARVPQLQEFSNGSQEYRLNTQAPEADDILKTLMALRATS